MVKCKKMYGDTPQKMGCRTHVLGGRYPVSDVRVYIIIIIYVNKREECCMSELAPTLLYPRLGPATSTTKVVANSDL